MTVVGLIAGALLLILIAFQLALAVGAPLGAAAWGGRNPGVLPGRLRIASAFVALVVYPMILAVIVAAAGLVDEDWLPIDPDLACWILAGFFTLGAVVNALSRSPAERIWAFVSGVLAACCVLIALG